MCTVLLLIWTLGGRQSPVPPHPCENKNEDGDKEDNNVDNEKSGAETPGGPARLLHRLSKGVAGAIALTPLRMTGQPTTAMAPRKTTTFPCIP